MQVADSKDVPVINESFSIRQLEILCNGWRFALKEPHILTAKEIVMIGSLLIKYETLLNQFYAQSGTPVDSEPWKSFAPPSVGVSINEVVHNSVARIEDTLTQATGLTNTIPRSDVKSQAEINKELESMGFVPAPGKAQAVDFSQFVNHDYDDDDSLMDL